MQNHEPQKIQPICFFFFFFFFFFLGMDPFERRLLTIEDAWPRWVPLATSDAQAKLTPKAYGPLAVT